MGFRSTTSNSAPPVRSKPLPIQGMLRSNKSGDGLTAVFPPVMAQHRRISRSALHRIFGGMLGAVFICYCCLMVIMMRHHHSSVFETEGSWGPTMATSQKVLHEHIHNLAEERRKELDERLLKQQAIRNSAENLTTKNMTAGVTSQSNNNVHDSTLKEMLEVDIHDMKPPESIQRSKEQEKREAKVKESDLQAAHDTETE